MMITMAGRLIFTGPFLESEYPKEQEVINEKD